MMPVAILVDSQFGNTARLAEAVAEGFGPGVSVVAIDRPGALEDTLEALETESPDLLVVAGPTIRRRLSPRLGAMLDKVEVHVRGLAVATFDTRLRGPGLFMGSAAKDIGKRLRSAGAYLVLPPEDFYVERVASATDGSRPPGDVTLLPGELDRARTWGSSLRDALAASKAA